ncbi:MAG: hypothetical protein ACOYMV_11900, partial [Verrucomicrobiia bacterium]
MANLSDFIENVVAEVKAGVAASQAGGLVRLPKEIKFSVEVVRTVNALARITTEAPGVTRTTTGVDSKTEESTETPNTTRTTTGADSKT